MDVVRHVHCAAAAAAVAGGDGDRVFESYTRKFMLYEMGTVRR